MSVFAALTGAQALSVGMADVVGPTTSLQPLFFGLAYTTPGYDPVTNPSPPQPPYDSYTGFGASYNNSTTSLGDCVTSPGTASDLAGAIAATVFTTPQATISNSGSSDAFAFEGAIIDATTITISGEIVVLSVPSTGAQIGMSPEQQAALAAMTGLYPVALYEVQPVYQNQWTIDVVGFGAMSGTGEAFNGAPAVCAEGGIRVGSYYDSVDACVSQNEAFSGGGIVYFVEYGPPSAPSYISVGGAISLPCVPCCNICGVTC